MAKATTSKGGLKLIKYVQKKGPPAEDFSQYKARIEPAFLKLINSNPEEKKVQSFLEKNPALVPGARTPGSLPSGFLPHLNACITQPRLPGIKGKVPDFLWFTMHSLAFYACFVELEKPGKKLFNKNEVPSADFTQARDQLAEWHAWFNSPGNQQKFRDDYGITNTVVGGRSFELHLLLVYGRRDETKGNQSLAQKRRHLLNGPNEELVSYDRLSADSHLADALTVKLAAQGQYHVKYIPPSFCLSPHAADEYSSFTGLDLAINSQKDWKPDRKKYLNQRLTYWMKWASSPQPGLRAIQLGYRE